MVLAMCHFNKLPTPMTLYLLIFQKDYLKRYYLHFLVFLSTDLTFSDQMCQDRGIHKTLLGLLHCLSSYWFGWDHVTSTDQWPWEAIKLVTADQDFRSTFPPSHCALGNPIFWDGIAVGIAIRRKHPWRVLGIGLENNKILKRFLMSSK